MGGRTICAALCALVLGTTGVSADRLALPFTLTPGSFLHFSIEHTHQDLLAGKPQPEVITRCRVRVSVDRADSSGATVLVHAESTDQTVDGERGAAPSDRRSLLLQSIATLVARVELSPEGVPLRVTNWSMLRDPISERARSLAGANAALADLAANYVSGLDESTAVGLLAEPLALAAAGRSASFDLPNEMLIIRGGLDLPSFMPGLWSNWAFALADHPSPDVVSITWEGVAGREALSPFLPMLETELGALAAGSAVDLTEQAATARQLFRADFARDDGHLMTLTGTMTLTAGPLVRTERIDIRAVP